MGRRVPVDKDTRCKICGEFAAIPWVAFNKKDGLYFKNVREQQYGTCSKC
jgi:hypothetical protein